MTTISGLGEASTQKSPTTTQVGGAVGQLREHGGFVASGTGGVAVLAATGTERVASNGRPAASMTATPARRLSRRGRGRRVERVAMVRALVYGADPP